MKKKFHILAGIILIALLLISFAVFIGGKKAQNPNRSVAIMIRAARSPVPSKRQPAGQIMSSAVSTPITTPGLAVIHPQKESPNPKIAVKPRPVPPPTAKPVEIPEISPNTHTPTIPEPEIQDQPGATPQTESVNPAVKITPVAVAVKPIETAPPAAESVEPSPVPESRLKIACDFESLGLGYEILQKKKTSLDLMVYTDKAGLGVSYRFASGIHLGVDTTYKYQNGEQQLRLYLSMSIKPGE